MAQTKPTLSGNIRVADVTIAQLSRGLYRSTATAFKELVSNAYDADATVVRINTNFPEFDFLSCVDDGAGMPLEQFLRYFSEVGIGSCIKRKNTRDKTETYGRPIIGRLGIGMLAIGQLCHSFKIESHYKVKGGKGGGKAYRATVVLEDITVPDMEDTIRNSDLATQDIEVGTWEYELIEYDKRKQGFRLSSTDVRKSFQTEMRSSIGKKELDKIAFSLPQLHSRFYDKSKKSIRDCKPYLETIWELAILSPLAYYGSAKKYPVNLEKFTDRARQAGEFDKAVGLIRTRQRQFRSENFRVIFDGIDLRRHVQLPTVRGAIPRLYFIDLDEVVFKSRLKFSGYIFAQIPNAIKPLELNGVQIRLRGVGIGGYDSTFVKYYKQIETIRSKWVSGEIFVDKGLESALNIDRDSFNEHDEHFKRLRSVLHDKLDTIFEEINAAARKRSDARRDRKASKVTRKLQAILAERSEGRFELLTRDIKDEPRVVLVDERAGQIIVNTSARPLRRKKVDNIIRGVMLAYHTAKRMGKGGQELDDRFYHILKDILGELL